MITPKEYAEHLLGRKIEGDGRLDTSHLPVLAKGTILTKEDRDALLRLIKAPTDGRPQ